VHISAALRGLADMVRSAIRKLPPLWVRSLVSPYERIPAQLKKKAAEIYMIDDTSNDHTFWAGMGYKLLHNILIPFKEEGMRIAEIPIPTHYGHGILGSLLQNRLHKSGLVRLRSHTFGE
jgi:hypothetical protein